MNERAGPDTPSLNVPGDATTVFLFGGTFDPPHRAHVKLALGAARRVDPGAWIVFVPAAQSPLKGSGPVASDADRVRMLQIATGREEHCVLWTEELRRGGTSYTIDTARLARQLLPPSTDLRLLIGSDQAETFHRWRHARQLVALTSPVVLLREPRATSGEVVAIMRSSNFWTEEELDAWQARTDATERIPLAATVIRQRIAQGEADADLLRDLDAGVLGYIRAQGLYTNGGLTVRS